MEATTIGMNRTGTAMSPNDVKAMNDAADALSPVMPIDTTAAEAERQMYISESETVGSIPPPASMKGVLKVGMAKIKGGTPSVLMDKLGERLAFERSGTRLYEALIIKYESIQALGTEVLPSANDIGAVSGTVSDESPMDTLMRIREEELEHFKMLCRAMEKMGGDPTAVTPCANLSAVQNMGIMQVITDPRTTLAQCLNAILTAELSDNAGWELLIKLTHEAGEAELTAQFRSALDQEQEHLTIVKGWLEHLVTQGAGTTAV